VKIFKVFSVLFLGLLIILSTALAQEQGKERIKKATAIIVKGQQEQVKQEPQKTEPQPSAQEMEKEAKTEQENLATKKQLPENFKDILAEYGKWEKVPGYGEGWFPDSNQEKDWAPYQKGCWQDYRDGDYLWVSFEPFGDLVYHFGRWQLHPTWGWYWIPTYAWGPAWVNWWWDDYFVCWGPMWYDYQYYHQYYNQYYAYSSYRGWTTIRRNQLKNPNLSQVIRTTQASAMKITSSQIQPNVRINQSRITANTRQGSIKTFPPNPAISRSTLKSQPTVQKSNLNRAPAQNRFADSPWSRKAQANSVKSQPKKYVGGLTDSPFRNDPRIRSSASPRMSTPSRYSAAPRISPSHYYSAPSRVSSPSRSGISSRISAPSRSFSAPRASSSRGGAVRRR